MPKNIFQRPPKPMANHAVPRHGAPLLASKAEIKKILKQKEDSPTLPPLDLLLGKGRKPD